MAMMNGEQKRMAIAVKGIPVRRSLRWISACAAARSEAAFSVDARAGLEFAAGCS